MKPVLEALWCSLSPKRTRFTRHTHISHSSIISFHPSDPKAIYVKTIKSRIKFQHVRMQFLRCLRRGFPLSSHVCSSTHASIQTLENLCHRRFYPSDFMCTKKRDGSSHPMSSHGSDSPCCRPNDFHFSALFITRSERSCKHEMPRTENINIARFSKLFFTCLFSPFAAVPARSAAKNNSNEN